MNLTIPCRHCGSPVAFAEEDRGHEVYCDSCGRANRIPAQDNAERPAADTNRPTVEPPESDAESGDCTAGLLSATVFSEESAGGLQHEVVGKETCLCGAEVPVRVEDFGGTVYCPSCGTEIRVGQTLEGGKFRTARPAQTQDAEASGAAPTGPPEPRRRSRALAVACTVIVLLVAGVGAYLTWRSGDGRPRPAESSQERTLPVPRIGGPRTQGGTPAEPSGTSRPEAQLTPALIEQLLEHPEPTEALVQARLWQEELRREEVDEGDPRLATLVDVIAALETKLKPPPEPTPAEVVAFRQAVQQMAEGLKSGDLDRARRAMGRAGDLLARHSELLLPHQHRYQVLKERLEEELKPGDAAHRIAQMLVQADRHQTGGRVTEALELEAQARFLALTTPLSALEAESLDRTERELHARLRLAVGERAVGDAVRYAGLGDVEARNLEVRRALAVLPGLPESQVEPLLGRLRPWQEEATAAVDRDPSAPTVGRRARQIRRRDGYESLLDHYAGGDAAKVLAACLELDRLLDDGEADSESWRQRIERPLFDTLEREVRRLLASPESVPPDSVPADPVTHARQLLDRAGPWKSSPRWAALDALVREHESRQRR